MSAELGMRLAAAEQRNTQLVQEAQFHAQEARTANATIADIYQLCSGAKGEPGNWHGAEPVRKVLSLLAESQQRIAELEAAIRRNVLVLDSVQAEIPEARQELLKAMDDMDKSVELPELAKMSNEKLQAYYIQLSGRTRHTSDCATSCAPAERPAPCDCVNAILEHAEQRIQTLEQERDALQSDKDFINLAYNGVKAKCEAAESLLAEARPYTQHKNNCQQWLTGLGKCTCGLESLLSKLKGERA